MLTQSTTHPFGWKRALGRGGFELIGGEYRYRWGTGPDSLARFGTAGPGTYVCSINSGGGLDVDEGTFRADPVV